MAEGQLVLGIIGYPVGHSLSPLMHNEALRNLGIEGFYVPFEVKPGEVGAALSGLMALGVKGVNVTIPHKQAVLEHLDQLDPVSAATGAVNTIDFDGGRVVGYNTDGAGFVASLREDAGEEVGGKRVLLIGAGGAARGLAVKLAMEGVSEILVINRTPEKGEALVKHLEAELSYTHAEFVPLKNDALKELLPGVDLIINATSVGMGGGDELPINPEGMDDRHLVCDIVYTPLNTPFLEECRRRGARTLDGLGMLIHQGDLAFQIWTGKRFPAGRIRRLLMEKLEAA